MNQEVFEKAKTDEDYHKIIYSSLEYRCLCGGDIWLCHMRPVFGKCEPVAINRNNPTPMTEEKRKRLLPEWFKNFLEKERSKAENHKEWEWPTANLHAYNTKMLEMAVPVLEAWSNTQSLQIAECNHCSNKYFDGSGKSRFCSAKCRVAAHKAKRKQ